MSKEQQIERFQKLFKGRVNSWGKYIEAKKVENKMSGRARTESRPLSVIDWETHLYTGEYGIGMVPVDENGGCNFAALDVDKYTDTVIRDRILNEIDILGLDIVPCLSKSGGLHLYVFFAETILASTAIELMTKYAASMGITNVRLDNGKIKPTEIFPKQTVVSTKASGSWINLPYYKGTRVAIEKQADGSLKELTLDEFLDKAESKLINLEKIKNSITEVNKVIAEDEHEALYEAPPCFKLTFKSDGGKLRQGERNEMMCNVAVYLKKRFPDDWTERIREYNYEYFDPPINDKEIDYIIQGYSVKDYSYKCKLLPICQFCDIGLCRSKQFGINQAHNIDFGDMTIVEGEPKNYLWTINGTEMTFITEDLIAHSLVQFKRKVFEQGGIMLPEEWKLKNLNDLILEKMKTAKRMELSVEATPKGVLFSHLNQFVKNNLAEYKTNRDKWRAIANHKVVLDKDAGSYLFKIESFLMHLDVQRFKEYTKTKITEMLRKEMNCQNKKYALNKEKVYLRYWSLPKYKLEEFNNHNLEEMEEIELDQEKTN